MIAKDLGKMISKRHTGEKFVGFRRLNDGRVRGAPASLAHVSAAKQIVSAFAVRAGRLPTAFHNNCAGDAAPAHIITIFTFNTNRVQ